MKLSSSAGAVLIMLIGLFDTPAHAFPNYGRVDYAAGNDGPCRNFAVGDFNEDGALDLAVPCGAAAPKSWLTVLINKGDGTFGPPQSLSLGFNYPVSALSADFNGDANLDIAVAGAGSISIFRGMGDGTFQEIGSPIGLAIFSPRMTAADFNADGKRDLAISAWGYSKSYVLLGKGDGTFQAAKSWSLPTTYMAGIAAGDFDKDGKADLAVTQYHISSDDHQGKVLIGLGEGNGTFKPPVAYLVGQEAGLVAVADLDSDGSQDLAVANRLSKDVSVLRGKGDGTFEAAASYATEADGSNGIQAADIDGDDVLDLAVGNYPDPSVSVLIGKGDGTVERASTYSSAGSVEAVAVADLNSDGMADLVSSNYGGSKSVSIFLAVNVKVTDLDGDAEIEEGGSGGYELVLTTKPQFDVKVVIATGEGIEVVPIELTFTPENWDKPQAVSVSAADDSVHAGDRSGSVGYMIETADPWYQKLAPRPIAVTIKEDDPPADSSGEESGQGDADGGDVGGVAPAKGEEAGGEASASDVGGGAGGEAEAMGPSELQVNPLDAENTDKQGMAEGMEEAAEGTEGAGGGQGCSCRITDADTAAGARAGAVQISMAIALVLLLGSLRLAASCKSFHG